MMEVIDKAAKSAGLAPRETMMSQNEEMSLTTAASQQLDKIPDNTPTGRTREKFRKLMVANHKIHPQRLFVLSGVAQFRLIALIVIKCVMNPFVVKYVVSPPEARQKPGKINTIHIFRG